MDDLISNMRALEKDLQSRSFELLDSTSSYDRAQQLLVIARETGSLADRLRALNSGVVAAAEVPPAPSDAPPPSGSYPFYFVQHDSIVKIGKGEQPTAQPYRQEADRQTFERVVKSLGDLSVETAGTMSSQSLEQKLDGVVPSYQVYLILGALVSVGALTRPRRGQYVSGSGSVDSDNWWKLLKAAPAPDGVI